MRTARFLIFFLVLCLLSSFVAASSYQMAITPIRNMILPNETAEFTLTVSNFERTGQRFELYTFDLNWVLQVEPAATFTVQPLSYEEVTIRAKPKTNIGYGSRGVTIIMKNLDDNSKIQRSLLVTIEDPNHRGGVYAASVQLLPLFPESIDCRKPLTLTLNLRNRNALNITSLTILFDSPLFQRQYTTSLGPLGEKTETQIFTLDPYQMAGEYPLSVKLLYEGKTLNEYTGVLNIAPITLVEESASEERQLFRSETTIVLENKGNVPTEYQARLPTGIFRIPFTHTSPGVSTKKIAGERYYVWSVTLAPQETVTLVRVENYRLLVALILLVTISVLSYYLFRSPVYAVKETISIRVKGADEKLSNSLKVRVFLKNRSGRQLTNVSVIDRIPSIAEYVAQEHLGSVTPTKVVTSEKKGTMLKWELDILEPYEERILTYALTSRLTILGDMRLPPAKVLFTSRNKDTIVFTKSVVYDEER